MEKKKVSDENVESILRKILQVNKKAAVILVTDMLVAGVDTVRSFNINLFSFLILLCNFSRLHQLYLTSSIVSPKIPKSRKFFVKNF